MNNTTLLAGLVGLGAVGVVLSDGLEDRVEVPDATHEGPRGYGRDDTGTIVDDDWSYETDYPDGTDPQNIDVSSGDRGVIL